MEIDLVTEVGVIILFYGEARDKGPDSGDGQITNPIIRPGRVIKGGCKYGLWHY